MGERGSHPDVHDICLVKFRKKVIKYCVIYSGVLDVAISETSGTFKLLLFLCVTHFRADLHSYRRQSEFWEMTHIVEVSIFELRLTFVPKSLLHIDKIIICSE